MKLSTQERYAVTAMLDLTLHAADIPCPLSDIARRQGISLQYLEQIFLKLRRNSLVGSSRGPAGGYYLFRPAAEISVAQILNAVGRPVDMTRCSGDGNCQGGATCLTHHLWVDLSDRIHSFLNQLSLEQLSSMPNIRAVSNRQSQDGVPLHLSPPVGKPMRSHISGAE